MKIATVTIYDALNCGSYLQAYALQQVIKKMGHEAVILDGRKNNFYKLLRKWIRKKNTLFYIKQRLKYNQDIKKLKICRDINCHFDKAIIGSDEVWNIKGHFEHVPQFFGRDINADSIIAYATSIGFCSVEDFYKSSEAQEIKKLHKVFPRDAATQQACLRILNQECPIGCDPTILFLDGWTDIVKEYPAPNEKYVLYYSYLDNTPMKENIIKYAHSHGLKIVCANFNYKWADKIVIPSPLEFLNFVYHAECVFTSTFHGTVFSTIFKKPLVVRPSGPKVVDYLQLVGLDSRIYMDGMEYETFKKMVEQTIDYNQVYAVLEPLKEKSIALLSDAIMKE